VYWSNLTDFLAMGGHAAFIWPAFAVGLVVFGILALLSLRGVRQAELELAAARREAGREPAAGSNHDP